MVKKKLGTGKKRAAKKKPASRRKVVSRTKPVRKTAAKKSPARKTPARRKPAPAPDRQDFTSPIPIRSRRGLGSAAGGQSGDIQGLSRTEYVDSESVEELAEEGQSLEAEVVSGVENAKDPDEGEVTTSEVPEDDVPREYQDRDKI
jgi:hypothetical protein